MLIERLSDGTVLSSHRLREELIETMGVRRRILGLSQLDVDHIAGLATGYFAKLEARLTNPTAPNARSIGWDSLPLALGALKLKLVVVPENTVLASSEHFSDCQVNAAQRFFTERAKAGAKARNAALSPEERSARARAAAQKRWASRSL